MELATLAAFALVATITIVIPGPTTLLSLANGSRFGHHRAMWGMFGAVASDLVLIAAVALGLGALLAASEVAFSVIKWVGVAYLAYLGIRLLLSRGHITPVDAGDARGTRRALFAKSFLVAVTNPKAYLFTGALVPQFISPTLPQAQQYLAIAIVFAALDFAINGAYVLLGSQAMRLLKARGALWLDRICGAVLLALAGSLAFLRRTA